MSKRSFFIFLFVYSVIQIVLRVVVSDSLLPDESEQIIYAKQGFAWGYGSEPPLYTWIQLIFFSFIPHKIFALSLCKYTLLFIGYLFMFLSAKIVVRDELIATACTCSLFFIPVIAFEAQRDLSHSVILFTMCCITLYLFLSLIEHPRTITYALIGFVVGLGGLSKYNYALYLAILITAWMCDLRFRKVFFNKRTLLAIIISAIIVCGHIFWIYSSLEDMNFHRKITIVENFSSFNALARTAITFFSFIGLFLVMFVAFFYKELKNIKKIFANKFLYLYIFAMVVLVLIVLIFKIEKVKTRWYLPLYFSVPIYAFAIIKEQVKSKKIKVFISTTISAALIICLVMFLRIYCAAITEKPKRLNLPIRDMATFFAEQKYNNYLIVAENRSIAGTLQLYLPKSTVITPGIPHNDLSINNRILLIWEKGEVSNVHAFLKQIDLPKRIIRLIKEKLHNEVKHFSKNYKYMEEEAHYGYATVSIPEKK
ncbi:ArnT family glycosyltransferase [Candidatus Uabimicrobium sp. HlEnr_7]|uniref:ArnT family glycosyltransferase n=1 Tax=Candidatus Uabimicrobium helgolandensis TaxID=3095367 RepID=UPI003558369C